MTINITLGWWLVPLAVTAIAFGWAAYAERDNLYEGGYPSPAAARVSLMHYGCGLVASLIAWLIWALLT